MSGRLLVVEPDGPGRAMMERVLVPCGYEVEAVASARDARASLGAGAADLAIVDEHAGAGETLDEVRWLRAEYPRLAVLVTGAFLTQRVLLELLRLGVADAVGKPFKPTELREAVARTLDRQAQARVESLEYAASSAGARSALAAGRLAEARQALARAQRCAPFDAETMALFALLAELEGHDGDADRGYRAALALREDEASAPPDPHEGLARLRAYGPARPARALRGARKADPLWLVTDPVRELPEGPPSGSGPHVVVLPLGLDANGGGAVFVRETDGPLAFALLPGPARPEALAGALARLGDGPVVAREPTRSAFDLDRLASLRGEAAALR